MRHLYQVSVFLIAVSLCMSLAGCAASKQSATTQTTNAAGYESNEIKAYYRFPNFPKCSVLPSSQSANVSVIIEDLHFEPPLSLAQQQRLMHVLYANIPQESPQGVFADIVVGQYFDDESPLLIRLGVFEPLSEFEPPADKIVILHANVLLDTDKRTPVKSSGRFASLDKNYWKMYVLFPDGKLVDRQGLEDQGRGEALP